MSKEERGERGLGQAGFFGETVRSDAHVAIEPRDGGGVTVELHSKVEAYYGDSILEQCQSELKALGVEHATVVIRDGGALPFVLGARLEAAARRGQLVTKERRVEADGPPAPPTPRNRLRRSRLYLPGNEPKYMFNARLHASDAVILDLEDSVHPDEKDTARLLVRNALTSLDFGSSERMVRINQLPLGLADLDEIIPVGPDLVLIPKVEHADEVRAVDERIREVHRRHGQDRPVWLMPILESALGVENAFDIAQASPQIVALTLGLEDLTADLGVVKTREGDETLYARQRTVNAARATSMQAIDSVFGDVGDEEGLRLWCRRSKAMGFVGMGCVHPRQVRVIHEEFAPAAAEIEKAQRIVAAFQEAEAAGRGVVSLGSKMIDPPVVQRALRLVEQAEAMGLLEKDGQP
jgi:citrate lyase subunit beta/citryl-CoA lyase